MGLIIDKKPNPMSLRLCEKTKDVIEPLMKPQWWVRVKELADPALLAVREGQIRIKPESAEKRYIRWLENVTDWCVSRQLWWGHQIPAWRVSIKGKDSDPQSDDGDRWVVALDEGKAREKAQAKFPNEEFTLARDPDV